MKFAVPELADAPFAAGVRAASRYAMRKTRGSCSLPCDFTSRQTQSICPAHCPSSIPHLRSSLIMSMQSCSHTARQSLTREADAIDELGIRRQSCAAPGNLISARRQAKLPQCTIKLTRPTLPECLLRAGFEPGPAWPDGSRLVEAWMTRPRAREGGGGARRCRRCCCWGWCAATGSLLPLPERMCRVHPL